MNLYRKQYGFTLIEVMIALSILGLLLVILYSSLFTTSKSLSAGNQYIDSIDDYRLVHNFLRQTIEQAQPLMQLSEQGSKLVFSGEHDRLGLTASLPSHRGGGGLYYIELYNSDNNVILSYSPVQTNDSSFTPIEAKETILYAENNVAFYYYGNENLEQSPTWHENWNNTTQLPALVRLQFIDNSSATRLADMTFAFRIKFSTGKPQFMLLTQQNKLGP